MKMVMLEKFCNTLQITFALLIGCSPSAFAAGEFEHVDLQWFFHHIFLKHVVPQLRMIVHSGIGS